MSYSLIIPIYNEGATLKKLLNEVNELDKKIEIIIINDGSNDETKSILDDHDSIRVIHNSKNKGKGSSIIIGADYALNDNLILMDGDLEISMNCIPNLIKIHKKINNSILVGSRWARSTETSKNINTIGNFVINKIFNYLYNTNVSDVLCCVKVLNQQIFKSLNLNSKGFSIEIELMSKLAKKKTTFHEIDIEYNRRKSNEGKKLKISDGWGILFKMILIRLKN